MPQRLCAGRRFGILISPSQNLPPRAGNYDAVPATCSQGEAVGISASDGKGAFPARRLPVGTSGQRQIQLSMICSNPAARSEGRAYGLSCADGRQPWWSLSSARSPATGSRQPSQPHASPDSSVQYAATNSLSGRRGCPGP